MANVDGAWDCVMRTPMGDQKAVFTVRSAGDGFTGDMSGALGSLDISEGRVNGDTLVWKMELTKPMRMTLHGKATVEGDRIEGNLAAGILGNSPLSGTRQA